MKILMFFAMLLSSAIAFAQEAVPEVVSNDAFLLDLFQSVGGFKGLAAVGIAVAVAQILIKFLKTSWGLSILKKIGPDWTWAVTSGLNIAAVYLGLVAGGVSWVAALTHAAVLMPVINYLYGIYERFIEKKKK